MSGPPRCTGETRVIHTVADEPRVVRSMNDLPGRLRALHHRALYDSSQLGGEYPVGEGEWQVAEHLGVSLHGSRLPLDAQPSDERLCHFRPIAGWCVAG